MSREPEAAILELYKLEHNFRNAALKITGRLAVKSAAPPQAALKQIMKPPVMGFFENQSPYFIYVYRTCR